MPPSAADSGLDPVLGAGPSAIIGTTVGATAPGGRLV
jgi:hypothetical protein